MRKDNFLKLFTIIVISFFSNAYAYDEPPVNLGFTSFLDGGPPSGPGIYFQNYFQHYYANRLNDNNGNKLPLPKTSIETTVNLTQLIFLSKYKLMTANLGVSFILPWLMQADIDDGLNNNLFKSRTGIGDLIIGPFFQFDPVLESKYPKFVHRIEIDFITPTGSYDAAKTVNPGSNFWSFNPYWAATFWILPKWTVSLRLHYLWNARNHNPNIAFGDVNFTQAGQAVFADFATDYEITEKLRIGLNGYVFRQISDTKANNHILPNRREQVWAIGPGLLYAFSKNDFLFLNTNIEQHAINRSQGYSGMVRYVHHF